MTHRGPFQHEHSVILCVAGRSMEGILALCPALVGRTPSTAPSPGLPSTGQTGTYWRESSEKTMKTITGLERWAHRERLRELGLLSLERRKLTGDLTHVHKCLRGCKEDRAMLSSVVPSDGARGNGHKLKHTSIPLKQNKTLF